MTDIDKILLVAKARVNVTEQPPNTNKGLAVESYQKATGNGPGDAWCCSFVVSCFDCAKVTFPFTRSGRVQTVVDNAKTLMKVFDSPQRGDLMVLWFSKLNRFAHICFVSNVRPDGSVDTIEGNTSGAGSREGWGVFERVRTPGERDKFLRW